MLRPKNHIRHFSCRIEQVKAIAITILLAVVGIAPIGALVRRAVGLRIAPEIERHGLDISQHGEDDYITS